MVESDTITNTLPFYLKADVEQVIPETLQMSFGKYDFFSTDSTRLFFDFNESSGQYIPQLLPGSIGVELPFSVWISSLFFLLFLFSLMILAFVFRWEATALKSNFKSLLLFGKYTTSVHKSQVTKTEAWSELYLLFQTVLVLTILIFTWLWSNGLSIMTSGGQSLVFIGIFALIALLIYFKTLIYKLIGAFFLQDEMKSWTTYYLRVMELLGLLFFLPVIFYIYLHEVGNIILICLIVLFFISRIVIYIELLDIFVKNKINAFYFFVYLCGIEIAPYLLLYKTVYFAITIAGDNII